MLKKILCGAVVFAAASMLATPADAGFILRLTNGGAVPEPGALMVLGAGLFGLATVARRRIPAPDQAK
jgi:hypothetical protein